VTFGVGAALTLTGCAGSDVLSAEEVSTGAEDALEEKIGVRPDISCPDALAKEEGATTRCILTSGEDPTELGVTVTVTSVDGGDDTSLGVQVDDTPLD
jgi:hypothetical protein